MITEMLQFREENTDLSLSGGQRVAAMDKVFGE